MTTKAAVIATVAILIGAMVLGLGALFLFVNPAAPGANQRAGMIGQGTAMLCLIPLFVVWILWAGRFRKEREQRQRSRSLRR